MKLSKWQEYGVLALLLLMISPFVILFFYSHPQSDDYFFAIKVNELGVFDFVKELYLTWSGRYFAMFLGALNPWVFGSLFVFTASGVYPISTYKFINAPINEKSEHIVFTSNFSLALYTVIFEVENFETSYKNWNSTLISAQKQNKKITNIKPLNKFSKIIFRSYENTYENNYLNNFETSYYNLDSVHFKTHKE